jgi:hypothetical protein
MTDKLPRQIPQDPAEQEAQMPEWVKVETRRLNKLLENVSGYRSGFWPHALTIWQWMPEPVDPDLLLAREVCAEIDVVIGYQDGKRDDSCLMQACLAMAKRVREAGK